jgi:hypothetical protein
LELPAFSRDQAIRSRVQRVGPPSRLVAVGVLALLFVVFLLVLGLTADDNGDKAGSAQKTRRSAKNADRGERKATTPAPASSRANVKLSVVAARPVWVCVVDARDRPRVDARVLAAGEREGPFTSKSFKVTVGNGGGDLRINGKLRDTPDSSKPVGFLVKSSGTTALPASESPTCG